MTTSSGAVKLTDFVAHRDGGPCVVRVVEGLHGHVPMRSTLCLRFDYGRSVPWVREEGSSLHAVGRSS